MHSVFLLIFLIGTIGLVLQTLLGGMHTVGGHTHVGHAGHAHIGHVHTNHAGQQHSASSHSAQNRENASSWLLTMLSPLTIFSVCLGAGAAGLILPRFVQSSPVLSTLAAVAGIGFYALAVRPLSKFIFRFESKPSLALEGAVASEAEVVSSFSDAGEGVVRLTVDGQTVRLLARLEESETTLPAQIHPGDMLTVTSIDGRANTCRVAKL